MRAQYRGLRQTPPVPVIATIAGNTAIAQSGFLFLQTRNRGGFSQLTNQIAYTLTAGQGLRVTLPADIREAGEDVREVWVMLAPDSDPTNARGVACFHGYQLDGVTEAALPVNIDLIEDEHFVLEGVVQSAAQLPLVAISGMLRSVSDIGIIQVYDGRDATWKAANPNAFSFFVPSITGSLGANRELRNFIDSSIVLTPRYAVDGSDGVEIGYWIVNDTSAAVPSGTAVFFTFEVAGTLMTEYIASIQGATVYFRGYVDTSTGIIDGLNADNVTTMADLDQPQEFNDPNFSIALPKDLPANSAVYVGVAPKFNAILTNGVILQGQLLSVFPGFGVATGKFVPGANVLGDLIYLNPDDPSDALKRITPGLGLTAIALPGTGYVNEFQFEAIGQQVVPGLLPNVDDQIVAITANGTCFVVDTLDSNIAQRALVGTIDGEGASSAFSAAITLDGNQTLSLPITYPTKIRDDYPDVIAGIDLVAFNAVNVVVYVRELGPGTIRRFVKPITLNVASETLIIGDLAPTGTVAGVPTPAANFGLHEPPTVTHTLNAAASNLPAGDHQFAIAYEYTNTITHIDHSNDRGSIIELLFSLAEVINRLSFWNTPVANFPALRLVTTRVNGETRLVTNPSGDKVHVVWDAANTDADNNSTVVKPADVGVAAPGRFVVVSGAGGSLTTEKRTITTDYIFDLGGANIIILTPGNPNLGVDFDSPASTDYLYFKLINNTGISVDIRELNGIFVPFNRGSIGGTGSKRVTAEWIVDEWVFEFSNEVTT